MFVNGVTGNAELLRNGRFEWPCWCNILMVMSSSIEIMMLLIMKSTSVSHVAHFSTVGVAQFCIVGNTMLFTAAQAA